MKKTKTRYWISWNQNTDDFRPLTYPPNQNILGWWCSGQGDNHWTLCAVVSANSGDTAKEAVTKDWPEAEGNWRFCNEQDPDFVPGDRFPIDEAWEKERFGIK